MAYKRNSRNFIKVYRNILGWQWYTDTNTKALFLHCLLRANYKAGSWKGISYEAGEFITSLPSMAAETGLTIQEVRTALEHLESTGEISSSLTDRATGKRLLKNRRITVNNWSTYQGSNRRTTAKATDVATPDIEIKKKEETEGLPKRSASSDENDDEWVWEDASVLRERMRKEREDEGTV